MNHVAADLADIIARFRATCAEHERTNTEQAWQLLDRAELELRRAAGQGAQQLHTGEIVTYDLDDGVPECEVCGALRRHWRPDADANYLPHTFANEGTRDDDPPGDLDPEAGLRPVEREALRIGGTAGLDTLRGATADPVPFAGPQGSNSGDHRLD